MIKQPIRAYGEKAIDDLHGTFVKSNFSCKELIVEILWGEVFSSAFFFFVMAACVIFNLLFFVRVIFVFLTALIANHCFFNGICWS